MTAPSPTGDFLAFQAVLVGRYSLDRELGRGGMGIVFLAREVALDRRVAIKLLPPQLTRSPARRERFLHEARTAAKLSHPNIVPIFAVEEIDQFVFFVMAYVDGETLGARLRARGALAPDECTRVLREVAWALGYAHSQGIVHRDVKPDNILLETASNRALVADFGIASTGEQTIDADIEVFGTAEYMSPEQATGEQVDGRSDLYSLGVVAFLALAGRLPFEGTSPAEYVAHHVRTRAPKLTLMAPGVPRSLAAAVARCLEKDPSARFQSGGKLADRLGAVTPERREIPVALRVFLKKTQNPHRWSVQLAAMGVWIGGSLLWLGGTGLRGIGLAMLTAVLGGAAALPLSRVRRLLAAGHDRSDLVHAIQIQADQRREELAFLFGRDYGQVGRSLRRLAIGAVAVAGVSVAAAIAVHPAFALGAMLGAPVAAVASHMAARRSDPASRWRLKLWRGGWGKAVFDLAGIGLRSRPDAPDVPAQFTEVAIGSAVLGLFTALPRSTQRRLSELPQIVQGLERDARTMRDRVHAFDELLEQVDDDAAHHTPSTSGDLPARRRDLRDRLRTARETASRTLADTVVALENLRLDLLRLRSGALDVQSVTANLGAARSMAQEIDLLLDAHRELEATLARQTAE